MFRNAIPSISTSVWRAQHPNAGRNIQQTYLEYRRLITVPSDDGGDDEGILNVCDKISSFGFYDDNDVKRYQKINNAVMSI